MVSDIICPKCQQSLPAGTPICTHCGTSFGGTGDDENQAVLANQRNVERQLPDIIKQFDTTATNNTTIAGVLVAFYSGGIFAGKTLSGSIFTAILYALPLALLLLTVIFSLSVFSPDGYLHDSDLTLARKKEQRLQRSSISLELAIGVLAIAVFVYLIRAFP